MQDAAPASDHRWALLEEEIRRHGARQDALIEILHAAQMLFGFLDRPVLRHVARALKLAPSKVFGVATFYHLFRLRPPAEHACVVCLGTACFVHGAERLLAAAAACAGPAAPDGHLSLTTTRCLGPCGIAPVVVFDGAAFGHATPETVAMRLQGWEADGRR